MGKNDNGSIVTIVVRKSSFTVSSQVNDKSAITVTAVTIALLRPYQLRCYRLQRLTAKSLLTMKDDVTPVAKVYFFDPYCSWQCGLNENTNGL